MMEVGSKAWWRPDSAGVTGCGLPEVVAELPRDLVAEVAARYGAQIAPDARAVRVSMGYTPPEVIRLPYREWSARVAKAEVAQARAAAGMAGPAPGEPSPTSAIAKRRRAVAQTEAIAARTERVRLALARGLTLAQVAAETGLSLATVGKASLRLLAAGQRPPTPKQALIRHRRQETARLLAEGASMAAVARHLNVPRNYVYNYLPEGWRQRRDAAGTDALAADGGGASCAPN